MNLCPNKAHIMINEKHFFEKSRCTACGKCAAECFKGALAISGKEESVEEVVRQVLDDKPYYEESGGGATISGGEPVLQGEFCEALLKSLRENGVHTILQTAGFYKWEMLERLLPHTDAVMYDIKGVSPEIFGEHVHADPGLAIENLFRLDKCNIPVIVRMPCIKNVNDSGNEIKTISLMLGGLTNLEYFSLLPYHGLAKIKYDILGREFRYYETPSKEHISRLEKVAAGYVKIYNPEKGFLNPGTGEEKAS